MFFVSGIKVKIFIKMCISSTKMCILWVNIIFFSIITTTKPSNAYGELFNNPGHVSDSDAVL